jgi:hypothetical protein
MVLPNELLAATFRKSGKTQDAFCAEQGITVHKLRYYLYKKGFRRNTTAAKSRNTVNTPRVPPPIPVEFISFNSQSGNNSVHTLQRQPMTIITGHFSIAEIIELVTKTGAALC